MKYGHAVSVIMTIAVASCSPDGSVGDGQGLELELPGVLHYESYWNSALVSFDDSNLTETVVKETKGIRRASISRDGQFLASQDGDYTLEVTDRMNPGNSFTIDNEYTLAFEGETTFSPDNEYTMQVEGDLGEERLRIRQDGSVVFEITDDDVSPYSGSKHFSSWSWIDNTSVLFSSGSHIYVVHDLENEQFELLKDVSPYSVGHLEVSHDGLQVAFTKADPNARNNEGDIYIMSADGSNEKRLTQHSELRSIAWSPDGDYLAFVAGVWLGGADPAMDLCPSLHVLPTSIEQPVTVVYGSPSESDEVVKLRVKLDSSMEDVCVDDNHIFWTTE